MGNFLCVSELCNLYLQSKFPVKIYVCNVLYRKEFIPITSTIYVEAFGFQKVHYRSWPFKSD